MRAIVHKTPGKLDLRGITTFGMNSKPATDTPIGYFGTGLKYAVAVLARESIPVKIYIDGKLWVIEAESTTFRNKSFTELYLCSTTVGGLVKKRIKLPFTTELGKNWELWQVFRELYSNTLDEKGETLLHDETHDYFRKGQTNIVIGDERYVQEFLERDKTFLEGDQPILYEDSSIQVINSHSKCVYYRGIKILDFGQNKSSLYTYNILTSIKLTEDRTAAEPFWVKAIIENSLVRAHEANLLERILTAEDNTYEHEFSFTYGPLPSETFLDVTQSLQSRGARRINHTALTLHTTHRPPKEEVYSENWRVAFVEALEREDWTKVGELYKDHKEELTALFQVAEEERAGEDFAVQQEVHEAEGPTHVTRDPEGCDDIPF